MSIQLLTKDVFDEFINNTQAKNSIYRGKFLGNEVTAEQYTSISAGTFDNMFIGDYWTINGINWRIAAFNYYLRTGDVDLTTNHVTIVPDTAFDSQPMNDTNTTTGGYVGSKMYATGLDQAKTIINNAFAGHVLNHRRYLSNSVTDGESTGGAYFDSDVELMNEIMVYGARINGSAVRGLYDIGTEKSQLPLFALNPQSINTRHSYWLRDVHSAARFAFAGSLGGASGYHASFSGGVRPAFSIS